MLNKMGRRSWIRLAGMTAAGLGAVNTAGKARAAEAASIAPAAPAAPSKETYETQAKGTRILPGQWRPHYPWEHIAWISPEWPSQDYLWLDFPEAIFTNQGLLFLSHVNPPIPSVFNNLPRVPWREESDGIAFERELPNGVVFGGRVSRANDTAVDLELYIRNGSAGRLADIELQTCAFLRAIREFGDYTRDNKLVHLPQEGWISLNEGMTREAGSGKYRVGWRSKGKPMADLPVVITISNKADRLFAMSWGEHTLSMVGNANHPCVHADPFFENLEPGQEGRIRGRIVFFEGNLRDFQPERHFT